MKKTILTMISTVLISGISLTSCNTPAEKVEDAKDKVSEANKDLDQAKEDYLTEIESYKKTTAERIEANNVTIADFKARIEHEKKDAKAEYENKIAELEQKNITMKRKMDDYKDEGKEKWEAFKTEFNHDMDELGQAFKDLTLNNKK